MASSAANPAPVATSSSPDRTTAVQRPLQLFSDASATISMPAIRTVLDSVGTMGKVSLPGNATRSYSQANSNVP